jgi:heme exporter protein A
MRAAPEATGRLEVRALAVSRGPAVLFRDLSFDMRAGELLALRGANGSGKTTLLRCVAGFTRPDSGEVLWDGLPTHAAASTFHAGLLYLGHLAALKDDLTAEENLDFALRLRGVVAPETAIRDALAKAGLAKRAQLPARRLSAGQRRRIGLARLHLDPAALWILDEPLAALDTEGEGLLAERLADHQGRGGLALVATHHDLPVPATRELCL